MGPEDQHRWDREDEEVRQAFAAKDAEIQRLNTVIGVLEAAAKRDIELIAELCDALEHFHPTSVEYNNLIQRSREATSLRQTENES